jgi:integrase
MMASVSRGRNGRRVIQFVGPDGKRRSVRLGKVPQKTAEEVKTKVEHLVAAAASGTAWDADTARWVAGVGDELAGKLAAVGLAPPRRSVTLGQWLQEYRKLRSDVARGTSTNYGIIAGRLLAFFDAGRPLHEITEADADRWLVWLKQHYAGATAAKSVKVARQFWGQAIRDGLAGGNPFAHLRTPSEVNTARAFFVDRQTIDQALAECPDREWRLLLALARYGGLRTPSEPLSLVWGDVNWGRQRFRVIAPKTEHQDGGERWVPLFPELRPYLEEAFERAEPGAVHVITRWRDTEKNLRTGLKRILRRAGLKPWPRLFQNLRASRETELAETYPIHVVADWLGNSPKTALAHYTQVTEEHYQRAAKSGAVGPETALQKPVQQPAASPRRETQDGPNPQEGCDIVRVSAGEFKDMRDSLMTPTGFEPVSRP